MSIKNYIYSLDSLLTQGKKVERLILMNLIILSRRIHKSNSVIQNMEDEQSNSRNHVAVWQGPQPQYHIMPWLLVHIRKKWWWKMMDIKCLLVFLLRHYQLFSDSSSWTLMLGLLWGSILGPLLFSLYYFPNINTTFSLMSSNLPQPSLLGYKFIYPTTFLNSPL